MVKRFLWEATKRFSITLLAVAGAHYCLDKAEPLIDEYSPTSQRPAIAEPSRLEDIVETPVTIPLPEPSPSKQEAYTIRELLEDAVYEP